MTDKDLEWEKALAAGSSGDLKGALFVFKKIAKQKDGSAALVEIGNIYEFGGQGVPKDSQKAKYWYEKSVSIANDVKACLALGRLYLSDENSFKDYNAAFEYFSVAQNEPGALYAMAYMCEKGLGIDKDYDAALNYYFLSANKGHALALRNYGLLNMKVGRYFYGAKALLKGIKIVFKIALINPNDPRLRIA